MILFENNLAENLAVLSERLRNGSYRPQPYYSFYITDPKERRIDALHYADRVVQHAVCDEALSKLMEPRLIYDNDNAACRIGKGTHFAMERLSGFLRDYYREHGSGGYILRYDIRHFFESIDHTVLKQKLQRVIGEEALYLTAVFIL